MSLYFSARMSGNPSLACGRGLYRIASTSPDSLIPSLMAALMIAYSSHSVISITPSSSAIQKIVALAISSSSARVFSIFDSPLSVSNRNLRQVAARELSLRRSARGAAAVRFSAFPDGNNGDNLTLISSGGVL